MNKEEIFKNNDENDFDLDSKKNDAKSNIKNFDYLVNDHYSQSFYPEAQKNEKISTMQYNSYLKNGQQLPVQQNIPSIYGELYHASNYNLHNITFNKLAMTNGDYINSTNYNNHLCSNNKNSPYFQTVNKNDSSSCLPQQTILMSSINTSKPLINNNNTFELLPSRESQNSQQTFYKNDQTSTQIIQSTGIPFKNSLNQHINEIYQYTASDQLSKSASIESNITYGTFKLLDTASSSPNTNDTISSQLIKNYPVNYEPSSAFSNDQLNNTQTNLANRNDFSCNNEISYKKAENDYVYNTLNKPLVNLLPKSFLSEEKNLQLVDSKDTSSQVFTLSSASVTPDCFYPTNFSRSRTTTDLNCNPSNNSIQNCLNSSVSTYSFINIPSNQNTNGFLASTNNSELIQSNVNCINRQFTNEILPNYHNVQTNKNKTSDFSILSSSQLPTLSPKESILQKDLSFKDNSSCNLAASVNCDSSNNSNPSNLVRKDEINFWEKIFSNKLRSRYLSKNKIENSSFKNFCEKKQNSYLKRTKSDSFSQTCCQIVVTRFPLLPCLLIFACALLLIVIGVFTLVTYYLQNQQQFLIIDQSAHSYSHTQLQHPLNKANSEVLNSFIKKMTNFFLSWSVNKESNLENNVLSNQLMNNKIDLSLLKQNPIDLKTKLSEENHFLIKKNQAKNWFRSAVFYEVFLASYQDSDGDGIGDIKGLISRLTYIKELGINVIRLNSIFSALDYPNRFVNILNHTRIEKQLGTLSDFRLLVENCHSLGIRIVLDLNPCLTSDQHVWAAHFLLNKTGDTHNYYVNTSDYVPLNEGLFHSNNYKDNSDEYLSFNGPFEDVQSNAGGHLFLNYSHPFISQQLIKTVNFWLNEGIDGFYLTSIHEIQFNQENPEHFIDLLINLKKEIKKFNKKTNSNDLDENSIEFSSKNKILVASKESLDLINKKLKRTLYEIHDIELKKSNFKFKGYKFLNLTLANDSELNSGNNSSKFTLNKFVDNYFQQKLKKKPNEVIDKFSYNIYTYFDLIDTFLDFKINGSEKIRDQVNEIYLTNNLDDDLIKSTSIPTVLWSIGDHQRDRLANRLKLNSILAAQFILAMLPGSISIFYGDEICLYDYKYTKKGKFYRNKQLVHMIWNENSLSNSSESKNSENIPYYKREKKESQKNWLPIDSIMNLNVEKMQEEIQSIQYLLQFRRQYITVLNSNYFTIDEKAGEKNEKKTNDKTNQLDYFKSIYQTYLFHYVNNGEIVFERYNIGKSRRRFIVFANLNNVTRLNDFSDKFNFGTIKVATNVKRLRDFLYLNSLKLESGEALIASVE